MLGSIIGKNKWTWTANGKHPIVADFFSIGCESALSAAFSGWVANGFRKLPQDEKSLPDLITWQFWSRGPKKDLICGVVRGSSDSFGRKFPLLVIGTGTLKGWESNLAWLPAAFEPSWSWIDYFAAKRMADYQQLEDEFRMIPTPKADWSQYTEQVPMPEIPSFEELAAVISPGNHTEELMIPLKGWTSENMTQLAGKVHVFIQARFRTIPCTVFMGGRPGHPSVFALNRPLANSDFLKLWSMPTV